jgi:hypothetical protein
MKGLVRALTEVRERMASREASMSASLAEEAEAVRCMVEVMRWWAWRRVQAEAEDLEVILK